MSRTTVALAAAAVAIGSLVGSAGPAAASHPRDLDCSDFRYYEDALDHLRAHPRDPDRLDRDGDGRPCESRPRRPSPAPAPGPAAAPAPPPCVYGAIGERWASLGGSRGFLGQPLTCELPTPTRAGRYTHFQGGSIYWSAPTGAWEVHGLIRQKWAALGWENSAVGFPTTNETRTPDGRGAYNHFQVGSVYWSGPTGAHEVRGLIRDAWAAQGWESGPVGFPTTDELPTPTKPGRYNHFQAGSVYWSGPTGAHVVRGAIRDLYADLGWEDSELGFPTSGEFAVAGTALRRQTFQHGVITWSPTAGAVVGDDPGAGAAAAAQGADAAG